ncbi:hypothetical protein [Vineibacter terrae]|uniref:hypothetical protein n=1 Tax=Vineibacter terrae TaxID=2586908 RepID=UPI002E2F3C75|nr:hypothetical protein [Vineibacter terrae]HEX2884913.1 hypothetical protein [Vineibacter terrae]
MSALGHLIEQRGIASTAIGLVRVHMEKIRGPRGLWVPFELGRPLGEPEDPAFQRRVLVAALRLLERGDGPAILEDYPEAAPGRQDAAGWTPAVTLPGVPAPGAASAVDWTHALKAELAQVLPVWEAAYAVRGRTTVGGGRLPLAAWPSLVCAFLGGPPPDPSPVPDLRAIQAVRYVVDDLKALYTEAAVKPGDRPSSRQVLDWFWDRTVAASLIRAVRKACLASPDKVVAVVGGNQLVPSARV